MGSVRPDSTRRHSKIAVPAGLELQPQQRLYRPHGQQYHLRRWAGLMQATGAERRPLPGGFIDRLRAISGERVQTGEAIRLEHGRSETHFASMPPEAVVFAESTDEVAALVRLCADEAVPVIP